MPKKPKKPSYEEERQAWINRWGPIAWWTPPINLDGRMVFMKFPTKEIAADYFSGNPRRKEILAKMIPGDLRTYEERVKARLKASA